VAAYLLFMRLMESRVTAILPGVFHPDAPACAADYANRYHPIPQKCLKSLQKGKQKLLPTKPGAVDSHLFVRNVS